jgi:uncharacterized protein GlcG (DUF336 family)
MAIPPWPARVAKQAISAKQAFLLPRPGGVAVKANVKALGISNATSALDTAISWKTSTLSTEILEISLDTAALKTTLVTLMPRLLLPLSCPFPFLFVQSPA